MIANAASMIAPDGRAYFLIYEGDRSDAGRVTKTVGGNPESWQNNRPAERNMAEIGQAFGEVARSVRIITASQPIAIGGGLAERTTG